MLCCNLLLKSLASAYGNAQNADWVTCIYLVASLIWLVSPGPGIVCVRAACSSGCFLSLVCDFEMTPFLFDRSATSARVPIYWWWSQVWRTWTSHVRSKTRLLSAYFHFITVAYGVRTEWPVCFAACYPCMPMP